MGPKWVGPRGWAQAKNLGPQKSKKSKVLKIKIRSAQNVGKVWISMKKILPDPFGALWAHFLHGPEKSKKCRNFAYFPWWAHGPYSPGLGPLLLSTRGGAIGSLCSLLTCWSWACMSFTAVMVFSVACMIPTTSIEPGTPWHGTARRTRRFMARHGTENHGTEKYWHGTARKILARKNIGTAWPGKNVINLFFWGNIFLGRKIRDFFIKCQSHHLAILINI